VPEVVFYATRPNTHWLTVEELREIIRPFEAVP